MALPFFYTGNYNSEKQIQLDEDTSRHVVQVLRMKTGDKLNLTDGKGNLLTCGITAVNKKHSEVEVLSSVISPLPSKKITIAVSLVKNTSRFEWFLEKATEIGVAEIIPLLCERTEKERFRHDRMNAICISAMLQSQQCWLPVLHQPVPFESVIRATESGAKFIAHCDEGNKLLLKDVAAVPSAIILIGPEGDFTKEEIDLALSTGFRPVSLGETRLRTETAGVVAATLLCLV
ncbi:MAG: 16S rRNA (uracil(1498)-N(3))-methyltransferase [Chitinophagaceae bacterium]|nr:16S rRNA (uracil(1498)-N(3))-methyltransferase [Chitinophagaceae bacterium]